MPSGFVVGELVSDQISLFRQDGARRLLFQLALLRFAGCRFGEQESVIRRDNDMAAVQPIDDIRHQCHQFVDGCPHGIEGLVGCVLPRFIDDVVIHIDDSLFFDELLALVLLHRHQIVGFAHAAIDRFQDLIALLRRTGWFAIHEHFTIRFVGQRLVGQQTGHAQHGVRRQHSQLRRQRRCEAVLPIEFLHEFLRRFVTERIADDDVRAAILSLFDPGSHMTIEEPLLVRNIVEPPFRQQTGRSLRINELAPGHTQRWQEPVGVAGFDVISERLEDVPAECFRLICRLAEVPVGLIEPVKFLLVGLIHRQSVREVEPGLMLIAQAEEVSRSNERVIHSMERNSWHVSGTAHIRRRPMSCLSSFRQESNVVGVECPGRALNSLSQLVGDGLFDAQKSHDVDEVADLETVQEIIELDPFRDVCRETIKAAASAG